MAKSKYPGLKRYNFPLNTREYVDQDYTNNLTPEEKEWLSKFNDEYYGGKVRKGDKTALNKKELHRKDCKDRQHAIEEDAFVAIKTRKVKFYTE
jgi:hypothetical protein